MDLVSLFLPFFKFSYMSILTFNMPMSTHRSQQRRPALFSTKQSPKISTISKNRNATQLDVTSILQPANRQQTTLSISKSNLLLAGQGRLIICCETKGNALTNELCPARNRHIVSIPQSPNFAGHMQQQAAHKAKSVMFKILLLIAFFQSQLHAVNTASTSK